MRKCLRIQECAICVKITIRRKSQIAELLNMQLTVYQRYERGERELPLWAAIKLADYYNVTLDYLVGREVK